MRRRGETAQGAASPEIVELFDSSYRDIYGYLARRVPTEIAEELASETFTRALESRNRFDPARGSSRGWLFGIATNLLARHRRDEVRAYQAYARAGVDPLRDGTDGVDEEAIARADAQAQQPALARALAQLRSGDRDVLLLVAHAGLTYGEVAQALDLPVGTVRSRLNRARTVVRTVLAETTATEGDKS